MDIKPLMPLRDELCYGVPLFASGGQQHRPLAALPFWSGWAAPKLAHYGVPPACPPAAEGCGFTTQLGTSLARLQR